MNAPHTPKLTDDQRALKLLDDILDPSADSLFADLSDDFRDELLPLYRAYLEAHTRLDKVANPEPRAIYGQDFGYRFPASEGC